DAPQRAHARWQALLAAYQAPPLDAAVDEALLDYIARRRRALRDEPA
ncbi:MAG: trimethylamine methyltransferase family protein, partial [Gammaproteobacteria bacterium]|nr:trimethylamine methyltransferase family protein [Gammaproteobacteria bacterium]